jgi:HPt (histidine-containing phosphotransfer) domain-containing protein
MIPEISKSGGLKVKILKVPPELKTKYLSKRILEIELIRRQIQLGDFSLAEKVGHQVKGSATTFGFSFLSEIGEELENAAIKREATVVLKLLDQFESSIKLFKLRHQQELT